MDTARTVHSLVAARQFINPQLVDDRVYFISDLSGKLSLYAMDATGSVPEPLLPPDLALQNPELLPGEPYRVFPRAGRIVVMIDHDGDENYRPLVIPLEGGFPEPLNAEAFERRRAHLLSADPDAQLAYLFAESADEATNYGMRLNVETGEAETLGESTYGSFPVAWTRDHSRVVLADGYQPGDVVLYERVNGERRMLWGVPLDEREEGQAHPLLGLRSAHVTDSQQGLFVATSLFDDGYGPGYLPLEPGSEVEPIAADGVVHDGDGELERFERLDGDRYLAVYNVDGESWAYEATFDEDARKLTHGRVVCGQGDLSSGMLHGISHDGASGRYAFAFCTARTPTQLYVSAGRPQPLTRVRPLGVDSDRLAGGEDASFVSHDGVRVSARLYLPAEQDGPLPLVYYIHGGPQSQERPNFAWFSMPLIQALVIEGFAVFVPNARGSTGYGQEYMKHVDHDWGGQDRLDHVHAMTEVLSKDERVDVSRAGVVGRSYGGYMTLTLAGRHPELWSAAVDMFGPYDLFTFVERVPPTWKPFFELTLGHPERDRDFLVERSPKTHIGNIACPLLVIQGANDPRVVEQESRDLVEDLQGQGKDVEYLVFDDEGHDVLKLENRVRCYTTIVEFFARHLAR